MSTVRDSQGNILNPIGPGCGRYTDANATEIDWFATHPRPTVPATLPSNSGGTLKVIAPIEGILATESSSLSFKTDSGILATESSSLSFKTDSGILATLPPNSGDTLKVVQPPYEDENGKTWLYNDATKAWDIPTTVGEYTDRVR